MKLKDKIALAHRELPLPSEIATETVIATVTVNKTVNGYPLPESQVTITKKTNLVFRKEYVGSTAIGWTFTEKVKVQ